jgi:hypothetical protein
MLLLVDLVGLESGFPQAFEDCLAVQGAATRVVELVEHAPFEIDELG